MTSPTKATFAERLVRRARRATRTALLKAADLCAPAADLGRLEHVRERVFTPHALGAPLPGLRYLLLGLCQIGHMAEPATPLGCHVDHVLYDSSAHAEPPAFDPAGYDAAIVAFTLRVILNEAYDHAAELAHAREDWTEAAAEAALRRCVASLERQLERLHARLPTTPTFVFSFLEPSFGYLGLLQRPPGLSDPRRLVRRLNDELAHLLASYPNFHLFDLNEAFDTVGRLHLQDDGVASFNHAGIIGTFDDALDAGRLAPFVSNHRVFDVGTALPLLQTYVFRTLGDAVKVIRGEDRVKLIILDLDDTLWRGVAAESRLEGWERVEGWPTGLAEALLYYKARGGLLAICSKNEEGPTRERFAAIWRDGLRIEDFASVRINWASKADNVREILAETNILPAQALFIDDNPRELSEVEAAFPDLRCLGGSHRDWRRIILRAPETQVAVISQESTRRTELVRARVQREAEAPAVDRGAWLRSLKLEARLWTLADSRGERFERALELVNKTNQFNTIGRRWTLAEIEGFLARDGRMVAATLKDRLVDNGLVGVALVRPGEVVQVVMSCRVFGLGLETALGACATALALDAPGRRARAEWVDTGRNLSCRGYFDDLGYARVGDAYEAYDAPAAPDWIALAPDRTLQAALRRPVLAHA